MRMNGKSKKYTYNPLASYWGRTFHELTLRLEKTPRRHGLVFECKDARDALCTAWMLRYHRDRAGMADQVDIRQRKLKNGSHIVYARRSKTWKQKKEDPLGDEHEA